MQTILHICFSNCFLPSTMFSHFQQLSLVPCSIMKDEGLYIFFFLKCSVWGKDLTNKKGIETQPYHISQETQYHETWLLSLYLLQMIMKYPLSLSEEFKTPKFTALEGVRKWHSLLKWKKKSAHTWNHNIWHSIMSSLSAHIFHSPKTIYVFFFLF